MWLFTELNKIEELCREIRATCTKSPLAFSAQGYCLVGPLLVWRKCEALGLVISYVRTSGSHSWYDDRGDSSY